MIDEDFGAPDELPDLVGTSDDEDAGPDLGATGSSPKEELPTNPTSPPVEVELEREPSTKRESPAIGKDTRGVGLDTFDGRGAVRRYKGSKRPPATGPEQWRISTAREN